MSDSHLEFTVSHSGHSYPVSLPGSATLPELRELLSSLTAVPISAQKLIFKGKNLSSITAPSGREQDVPSSLSSLGITSGSKILMIGSSASSAVVAEGAALQRRLEASKTRQTVKPRTTARGGKMVMDMSDLGRSSDTRFGKIEVLQGCPCEDLRKERLQRLAKDEAVLECMNQRDWHVGLLTELHPHRDPSLLGLNKNAGEAVLLRIMTDDLSGLRPYFHTRMVLLHELTHNKHGDHDEAFKTLNSLLNKEVKAFEAAKAAGAHRLGGEIHDAYEAEEEVEQMCGSADSAPNLSSSTAKAKRKPAARTEDGPWEMEQRRRAMLEAAEARSKTKGP